MFGIVSFGAYVPAARLAGATITEVLGSGGGKGTRAVASHDEDTTSMGVEAARVAFSGAPAPESLLFATCQPAYLDKANATALHAALGLSGHVGAYDMVGSVRSGSAALRAALDGARAGRPSLVVLSDMRTGLPGATEEAAGGDAAAAFVCGDEGVVAELLGTGAASAEFLDRWRAPGEPTSRVWEERFAESIYVSLAEAAVGDACKQAGVTAEEIDHVVVAGLHARAARGVPVAIGVRGEAVVDDLSSVVGNSGCAHPGLVLADVLDRAEAGETVLVLTLSDGADAMVFRTTDALAAGRAGRRTVRSQVDAAGPSLDYARFLTWRGMLRREPPRRPDPQAPAAPPAYRREDWKFAFVGSRCEGCGARHLPPHRVCVSCGSVDQMVTEALADVRGTIATFTVDRLAYSLSPPVVVAIVDFDGGGRYQCEMTDVDPTKVAIGDRVEMTFRRLFTANGIHNYFWKARPARGGVGGDR